MDNKTIRLPKPAVKGIASGLMMMALFTLVWSGIAYGGLAGTVYWPAVLVFPLFSLLFIINGVRLFGVAKTLPAVSSDEDRARAKKTGMWFGIIFGTEGLGIFIAVNVVAYLGHPELQVPAIALVVGLHFFPLAKVFRRTVDYYLAAYSTLVALAAFYFSLSKIFDERQILAFTGIGIAIATVSYGLYMLRAAKNMYKP